MDDRLDPAINLVAQTTKMGRSRVAVSSRFAESDDAIAMHLGKSKKVANC